MKGGRRARTPGGRRRWAADRELDRLLARGAAAPIADCLWLETLFQEGTGTVLLGRRPAGGRVATARFTVDAFCLGVKKARFAVYSEDEYEQIVQTLPGGDAMRPVEPACALKLLQQAAAYARGLGFPPHEGCEAALRLFGATDPRACTREYAFGHEGRPLYVRGPGDGPKRVREILQALERRCGPSGYAYRV